MGEAKRRRDLLCQHGLDTMTIELTKKLTDDGLLTEAGWLAFRAMTVPKDAPQSQLEEMKCAFFAGAYHLFSSIVSFLEEGVEPTQADLRRMDQLSAELQRFREQVLLPRSERSEPASPPPHPERLGDQPIEERHRKQMTAIAQALDDTLNPGLKGAAKQIGFVLLLFAYGEREGRCNFISNGADRKDVVTLFKEMIARFEGQPEVQGSA